ncbi:hypothetical protein DPX16_8404 [Anabarilius grahami]|uniref:Uncharacterized protein n=1 Tax=Anabarilius grahami TaxID=495550 RepID=A0A3N0Z3E5_ANAGA|nr:hypothetical protein DPX16_8404 [Anabarilius grahami]
MDYALILCGSSFTLVEMENFKNPKNFWGEGQVRQALVAAELVPLQISMPSSLIIATPILSALPNPVIPSPDPVHLMAASESVPVFAAIPEPFTSPQIFKSLVMSQQISQSLIMSQQIFQSLVTSQQSFQSPQPRWLPRLSPQRLQRWPLWPLPFVHESAPEPAPAHESAPELASIYESIPESTSVHESSPVSVPVCCAVGVFNDAGTADIPVEGNYEEDEDLQIPRMLTHIYLYRSLKNFGGYQNLIVTSHIVFRDWMTSLPVIGATRHPENQSDTSGRV